MPTPEQLVERIRNLVPEEEDVIPNDALDLSRRALDEHPDSVELLCLRGELLQLASGAEEDAYECFARALELAPVEPVVWELMADYLHESGADLAAAEEYYRGAIDLGGAGGAFAGLARVLAEQGRRSEALEALAADRCRFHDEAEVAETRREIEAGDWDPA